MAMALAVAREGTWFGLPAFRVRSKFFAGPGKDGASRVPRRGVHGRKRLMEAEPYVRHATGPFREDRPGPCATLRGALSFPRGRGLR